MLQAITALPERRWRPLPEYDLADGAELRYQPTGWARPYRYGVNRELAERKSGELYWKYHALVTTDHVQPVAAVMVWHLQQADRENASKEPKKLLKNSSCQPIQQQADHAELDHRFAIRG